MRSWVIEDEPEIGTLAAFCFERSQDSSRPFREAKQALDSPKYDLAIVDKMLRATQSISSPRSANSQASSLPSVLQRPAWPTLVSSTLTWIT